MPISNAESNLDATAQTGSNYADKISGEIWLPCLAHGGKSQNQHDALDPGLHPSFAFLCHGNQQRQRRLRRITERRFPGFVKVLNDKQLLIPDVAGNKLFHGYGNIETNPKIGLIFFIPGHNQTVRINGRVKVIDSADLPDVNLEVHDPDAEAKILQGLLLDVEESYSHCPRALKFSKLWDVSEIIKNRAPPVPPKEPGI